VGVRGEENITTSKRRMGEWNIAPHVLNQELDEGEWSALAPPEKIPRYQLFRRLGGHSGEDTHFLLDGSESRLLSCTLRGVATVLR
jgi:hypothetical protein